MQMRRPAWTVGAFGHLVQSLDVEPLPGTRYRMSSWVRGAIHWGDKTARLAVADW